LIFAVIWEMDGCQWFVERCGIIELPQDCKTRDYWEVTGNWDYCIHFIYKHLLTDFRGVNYITWNCEEYIYKLTIEDIKLIMRTKHPEEFI